jgi:hypothetical protein
MRMTAPPVSNFSQYEKIRFIRTARIWAPTDADASPLEFSLPTE